MSAGSPLAPRQLEVWSLRRDGTKPVEIARRLDTSRQFVHQTLDVADAKISHLLTQVAKASKIEIQHLDVRNGILLGNHRGLETQVVISFSAKHEVQIWYWYDKLEACDSCELENHCRTCLLDEAEERGITLTTDEKALPPAKLARNLFSRLIPGLKT